MKPALIYVIGVLVLTLGGMYFYWYQYRPAEIAKTCHIEATKESPQDYGRWYEDAYYACLHGQGIK